MLGIWDEEKQVTDCTNELNSLFETEYAYRTAAFHWNQLDDESKKNDLIKVFDYSADNGFFADSILGDELIVSRLL